MTDPQMVLYRYKKALIELEKCLSEHQEIDDKIIIEILLVRDDLQLFLDEQRKYSDPSSLQRGFFLDLAQQDTLLRKYSQQIAQNSLMEHWKSSFSPPETAWWWHFDKPLSPHDRLDWFWDALTLISLTSNLTLVTRIVPLFLTGVGLGSALAVTIPSVLALFNGASVLGQAGKRSVETLLERLKLPKEYWHGVRSGISVLISVLLIAFYLFLPALARRFNQAGEQEYSQGNLASALQDFEQALKLNPDLIESQFNLGLVYTDLQEPKQAQVQYRKAISGGYPPAFNNLAYLYLSQPDQQVGTLDQAVSLLLQGLDIVQDSETDLRASMHKNLGWARLKQERLPDAVSSLREAIRLNSEQAASYCLLAQILEKQGQEEEARKQWETFLSHANKIEDDHCIGLAQQTLDQL